MKAHDDGEQAVRPAPPGVDDPIPYEPPVLVTLGTIESWTETGGAATPDSAVTGTSGGALQRHSRSAP